MNTAKMPPFRGSTSRMVLADQVYEELMLAFIDGRLVAGQSLNIDSLARDLEVSPTPIREALARLEATGLVIRAALKGYRVAPLFSVNEILELMDARQIIEPENAFHACQRATADLISALQTTIDELAHSIDSENFATIGPYWQADERFHRLIAEQAGNRFLLAAYTALGGHVQRFRLFGGLGVSDAQPAIAEHSLIVEAFRKGDPVAARATMDSHICGVRSRATDDASRLAAARRPSSALSTPIVGVTN